jgi:hypothetical protein
MGADEFLAAEIPSLGEVAAYLYCSYDRSDAHSLVIRFLECVDCRRGKRQLFGIRYVARNSGINELHPKELVVNEFQERLEFLNAHFYGKLLHLVDSLSHIDN